MWVNNDNSPDTWGIHHRGVLGKHTATAHVDDRLCNDYLSEIVYSNTRMTSHSTYIQAQGIDATCTKHVVEMVLVVHVEPYCRIGA